MSVVIQMVPVACNDDRNLGMVSDVICNTTRQGPPNRSFTTTSDDDIVCMFLIGYCDYTWSRFSMDMLHLSINLQRPNESTESRWN